MYLKALCGAVAAGVALIAGLVLIPGTDSTPSAGVGVTQAAGHCFLGTYGGKGGKCRDGSLNDGKRWKESLKETGTMYKDAGECAFAGVASNAQGSPSRTPMELAGRSMLNGAICGASKPEGDFGIGDDE